jgi:hypothetical protein
MLLGGIGAVIVGSVLLLLSAMVFLEPEIVTLGRGGPDEVGRVSFTDCTLVGVSCDAGSVALSLTDRGSQRGPEVLHLELPLAPPRHCVDFSDRLALLAHLGLPDTSSDVTTASEPLTCVRSNHSTALLWLEAAVAPGAARWLFFGLCSILPLACVVIGASLSLAAHPATLGLARLVEQHTRVSRR